MIGAFKLNQEKSNVVQGDEIEFVENEAGGIILEKVRRVELPENVRPEVLEVCYDVFEEDREIFDDLRES